MINPIAWLSWQIAQDVSTMKVMYQKGIAQILLLIIPIIGVLTGLYLVQQRQIFKPKASEIISETDEIKKLTSEIEKEALELSLKSKSFEPQETEQDTSLEFKAVKRQQLLTELIEKDPDLFLSQATLTNIRDSFPETIQPYIEESLTTEGTVQIVHGDDFDNKVTFNETGLATEDNQLLKLHKIEGVNPGAKVVVEGVKLGQDLVIKQIEQKQQLFSAAESRPVLKKNRKAAVILVGFSTVTRERIDKTQIQQLFNEVDGFFNRVTLGQYHLTAEIMEDFTINYGNTTGSEQCNLGFWDRQIKQQVARNRGINPASFDHLIYIFQGRTRCQGIAYGTINKGVEESQGIVWVVDTRSALDSQVYLHEIGHNLSFDHANGLSCNPKQITSYNLCEHSTPEKQGLEYADPFDIMGSGREFNGPHQIVLGGVSSNQVVNITKGETYQINKLSAQTTGPKVLKIPKPDTNEFYYVSYNPPVSALIHIWDGDRHTKLIDTAPEDTRDFNNAYLTPNNFFYDPINKILIALFDRDLNYGYIQVQFDSNGTYSRSTGGIGR